MSTAPYSTFLDAWFEELARLHLDISRFPLPQTSSPKRIRGQIQPQPHFFLSMKFLYVVSKRIIET